MIIQPVDYAVSCLVACRCFQRPTWPMISFGVILSLHPGIKGRGSGPTLPHSTSS